jgi:hypothetical protein
MNQHPKLTVVWAMNGVETAIKQLGDSPSERRVRDQFHQLLLALERDGYPFHAQQLLTHLDRLRMGSVSATHPQALPS